MTEDKIINGKALYTPNGKGACAMLACHADEREDGRKVVFERI